MMSMFAIPPTAKAVGFLAKEVVNVISQARIKPDSFSCEPLVLFVAQLA